MKKALIVVDMQNDFISGALGSAEAQAIVPAVCEKIRSWDGIVYYTKDTHTAEEYLNSTEGKDLPVSHCLSGSHGWNLHPEIMSALIDHGGHLRPVCKDCFGSHPLARNILSEECDYVELIGLCTDVCVISNAIIIRNSDPYIRVAVDASCCAGVTPERHHIALQAMQNCGIQVINA